VKPTCSVVDCSNQMYCRTVCYGHYRRHQRAGTLDQLPNKQEEIKAALTKQRPKPAKRRLWAAEKCGECEAPPLARGLCGKHYQRAMLAGNAPPTVRVALAGVTCSVRACTRKAVSKTYCTRHCQLARRYKLSGQQMADLPTACESCGSDHRLHTDHCHEGGQYRGVLCSNCNTSLGMLGEDPVRIRALASYIEERRIK